MPEVVVSENTPALFFRDQLITAMEHQRVSTSAFTESYLVNLLSAFAKGETLPSREPGFDETPLALLYARALTAARFERVVLLRSTADTALFVSGFFAESLPRRAGGPALLREPRRPRLRAPRARARARGPFGHLGLRGAVGPLPAVRRRAERGLGEDAAHDAAVRGAALRALARDGERARGGSARRAGHHARRAERGHPPLSGPAPLAHDRVGEIAVCVQRRLESLYALDPEAPVTDYLVPAGAVSHLPGGGSRTLVAQEGDEVSVGVVLDESVGAGLERTDPRERLDGSNLGSFTTLTEEVSHFLYVLSRARRDRSMTQLELELQGEIDKYLVVLFFRGLEDEGAVSERLRQLLFERYELTAGLSVESSERYHEASRLANRYCGWLEARYLGRRRREALQRETRRFWRLGQREKLETIAGLRPA